MKFVDSCKVKVAAGGGGNGCVAFRREKYVPHGGPSGGDGGKGGDVIFVGDEGRTTLLDVAFTRFLEAERGEHGRGKDQYGKGGEDLVVRVPIGTQAFDRETGELVFDVDAAGKRVIVARGGAGGEATSTSRPRSTARRAGPIRASSAKRRSCASSSR